MAAGLFVRRLHFFGGVAKLTSQPKSNKDEIAIAAAGPAVSFALAGLGFVLSLASGWAFFELFALVNLVIAVFNLIPALPMDGGRILRASLASRLGHQRATVLAVRISRFVSIAFAVIGLAYMHIQLLLLAGVLWAMASAELRFARGSVSQNRTMGGDDSFGPPHFGPPAPPVSVPRVVIVRRY